MPTAEHAGAVLYWEEKGSGLPLLMIQGLGYSLEMWYRLLPGLARDRRVLTFDNRGVGRTGPQPPYSIEGMADDALAVLAAANVDRADVLGVSMGGAIAQELVLRHPEHVRAVILGCTSRGGAGVIPAEPRVLQMLADRVNLPVEASLRAMIPVLYHPRTSSELIEADLAIRRRTYALPEGYLGQLAAVAAWPGAGDRLRTLAKPVLVLHGDSDQLVPLENGRVLARSIPGAQFVLVPKASHLFFTEQAEFAAQAVRHFLSASAGLS